VLSFIMLHHVIDWEAAVGEAVRVLRPGGMLVGYDVVASRLARWLHQAEGAGHRLMTLGQLRDRLGDLLTEMITVRAGLAGLVVRFRARKQLG
jgi:ubiquinone/menaquinone biosynthesis C-methylase UbiE